MRSSGSASRPASSCPAAYEPSAPWIAAVARAIRVVANRAAATASPPSETSEPRIWPAVEQPITVDRGKAAARSRKAAGSSPRSGSPKATTSVRPESSAPGAGVDQPEPGRQLKVSICTAVLSQCPRRPGPGSRAW